MVLERLRDGAAELFLSGTGVRDFQDAAAGYEANVWGQLIRGAGIGAASVASLGGLAALRGGGRAALRHQLGSTDELGQAAGRALSQQGGGLPPGGGPRGGAPVRDPLTERLLSPSEDVAAQMRHTLPEPLDLGETGFSAVPGTRTASMSNELAAREPFGVGALERDELASIIRETDEFQRLFRMERDLTSRSSALSFDGRGARAELHEWAARAGLDTPPDTMSTGALENGLFRRVLRGEDQRAAEHMAQRLQNLGRFASQSAYEPAYYRNYHDIITSASARAGLPDMPVNTALSSASAQAGPFDEVQRLYDVVPFLRADKGRVVFDEAAARAAGKGESFHRVTGRAFAETLNDPDFLARKVSGQAAKTHAYTSLRHDPEFAAMYVADTVDGLGQFWVPGRNVRTSSPAVARWNQLSGRVLAEVYGVPPGWMQESLWNPIRVAREGSRGQGRGLRDAFVGRLPGTEPIPIDEALTIALRRVPDEVRNLGNANYRRFVDEVASGSNPRWAWDTERARPVFRSVDDMLSPAERGTGMSADFRAKWKVEGGRHETMQRQALEASVALGANVRSRIAAFSASTGVPVAVLLAWLAGDEEGPGRGEVTDRDVSRMMAAWDDVATGWV